ncbi:hypothetical protein [Roseospira navarrensis]|uniref:Uncharacterized protein n=1 Tax=Roseospira navarrensis TaxID=140058 RepID=A0A7X1ZF58_9PROT|nr:hypothetical protein [Roseospira navarrensis]MQX36874.1 hypothetical protein [Roseospira navarrensis]
MPVLPIQETDLPLAGNVFLSAMAMVFSRGDAAKHDLMYRGLLAQADYLSITQRGTVPDMDWQAHANLVEAGAFRREWQGDITRGMVGFVNTAELLIVVLSLSKTSPKWSTLENALRIVGRRRTAAKLRGARSGFLADWKTWSPMAHLGAAMVLCPAFQDVPPEFLSSFGLSGWPDLGEMRLPDDGPDDSRAEFPEGSPLHALGLDILGQLEKRSLSFLSTANRVLDDASGYYARGQEKLNKPLLDRQTAWTFPEALDLDPLPVTYPRISDTEVWWLGERG